MTKKKIFMVFRLFTGFETSLKKKKWMPEGVPTVYRLLEGIQSQSYLNIYFLTKDSGSTYFSNWKEKKDIKVNIKDFNANIYVLAGINYFKKLLPKKLLMILRDFRHLIKIIKYINLEKPDIIYFDSSNVVIAAFIRILFPKTPIVLRILGVCSFLRTIVSSKKLIHNIYRLAFKSNFSNVIATQDGSGIEYWLDKVLRNGVKRHVLLNGVDIKTKKKFLDKSLINFKNKNKNKIIILFLGRLEEYKGINNFIDAAILLLKKFNKKLHFVIVGNGSLYNNTVNRIKKNNYTNSFTFLRNIPHKKVMQLHHISDIYVSVNNDGNLSNANLEAISSNDCMVIPKPRKLEKIDIKTFFYLQNSVIYYDITSTEDLIKNLKFLIINPSEINKMKIKISETKNNFLKSWEQRVKEEKNILFDL